MGHRFASSKRVVSSGTLSRWWIVAGLIAATALTIEAVIWLRLPPPPPTMRSSRQITNDGLHKHNLVASKDGTQLYFDDSSSDHSTLMRVSTAGGAIVPVDTAVADPHILDVSTQSELLISSGGAEMENVPFWMVSTPTGSARRMGEVLGHDAVWEPGGALVFVNGKDLYIAEHDGANPRKLVEAQGPPFSLRFSPDGSRLRFTIGDPNSRSTMWQVRADGSGMVPVLPLPGWKAAPAPCCGTWTPNGKYFVFVVAGDIWVVADRPGKYFEPVQLTSGPLRYGGLVPSRDGKGLFAIGVQPKAELVHYDAPSGQFVPFLGGISAGDVDFSRDAQWVAYVTYPDGSLWRSKVDGSEPLLLISAPMQAASAHWSPDGMRIAFSGHRHGEPWKVWLVSKDGGSPEPLTPVNAAEADPTWSPDGKSLALVRFTRPPHIVLLDVSSHGRSELTRPEGLWRPRWSPDGRFLAAVSADSKFLMICDLNTHRWRRLAGSVGTIGMPAWSEDGAFIFFDDNSTHDSKYLRVRVSDGKVEQLASLRTVRRYLGNWGFWSGLTTGNALLLTRDASKSEVYRFDWRLP